MDNRGIAQVFGALTVSDLTARLPAYKSPTLIVNGEFDNALKGGTLTASLVNSPTFTTDRGFTGNGSTSYLDSGYNVSTGGGVYAQDSAHMGVYVLNNINDSSDTDDDPNQRQKSAQFMLQDRFDRDPKSIGIE